MPIPSTPHPVFSATRPTTGSGNASTKAVVPNTVITCNLNVQNPHNSTHVGGTINVVATIGCNVPAASLSIAVTLWKSVCDPGCQQVPYGATGTNSNAGSASIQANSAAACTSGDYFGVASGEIVSPPGYTPPSGSVSGQGATVSITC